MKIRSPRKNPLSSATAWWVVPAAFLATLLALPVNAGILIPDEPLATGNRVAPNVLFILDDSGSMASRYMYNVDVTKINGPNGFESGQTDNDSIANPNYVDPIGIYDQNFKTKTLYDHPAQAYLPWGTSGGNDMTSGRSYAAAHTDIDRATGARI